MEMRAREMTAKISDPTGEGEPISLSMTALLLMREISVHLGVAVEREKETSVVITVLGREIPTPLVKGRSSRMTTLRHFPNLPDDQSGNE